MAFYNPCFTFIIIRSELGTHQHPPVNERQSSPNPHNSTPGPEPDGLPYIQFLKLVREKIAVRCRILIDEKAFRAPLHIESSG